MRNRLIRASAAFAALLGVVLVMFLEIKSRPTATEDGSVPFVAEKEPDDPEPVLILPEKIGVPELPYDKVPVSFNGYEATTGYVVEKVTFLPLSAICKFLGYPMSWSGTEEKIEANISGVKLTGEKDTGYIKVDGRYLFSPDNWIIAGDELFLTRDNVERLLGLKTTKDAKAMAPDYDFRISKLMTGDEDYYEKHYDYNEIFWYAHIIHSEARWEPMAGKIGVGNVIQNRIKSKEYPNTLIEVIFDAFPVVQFQPVMTGGIREYPDKEAYIATYLLLEGYNTVGDCMYFVNREKGSEWFDEKLQLVVQYGNHTFYTYKY